MTRLSRNTAGPTDLAGTADRPLRATDGGRTAR
jgi:hypothetical protein